MEFSRFGGGGLDSVFKYGRIVTSALDASTPDKERVKYIQILLGVINQSLALVGSEEAREKEGGRRSKRRVSSNNETQEEEG